MPCRRSWRSLDGRHEGLVSTISAPSKLATYVRTVQRARGYDAVLLISVGVLGSPAEVVGACRRCVGTGGLMIIDDAYLRQEEKLEFPGYEQLTTRDETLRQLASHGDHVVREQTIPVETVRAQNRRYTQWIERRAEELAASAVSRNLCAGG